MSKHNQEEWESKRYLDRILTNTNIAKVDSEKSFKGNSNKEC